MGTTGCTPWFRFERNWGQVSLGHESGTVVPLLTNAASAPQPPSHASAGDAPPSVFAPDGEVWRVLTPTDDVGNTTQGTKGAGGGGGGLSRMCPRGGGVAIRVRMGGTAEAAKLPKKRNLDLVAWDLWASTRFLHMHIEGWEGKGISCFTSAICGVRQVLFILVGLLLSFAVWLQVAILLGSPSPMALKCICGPKLACHHGHRVSRTHHWLCIIAPFLRQDGGSQAFFTILPRREACSF